MRLHDPALRDLWRISDAADELPWGARGNALPVARGDRRAPCRARSDIVSTPMPGAGRMMRFSPIEPRQDAGERRSMC
jgi:hypothetical protein